MMKEYFVRFVREDGTKYGVTIKAETKEQALGLANCGLNNYGNPYKENGATVECVCEPIKMNCQYWEPKKIIGTYTYLPH